MGVGGKFPLGFSRFATVIYRDDRVENEVDADFPGIFAGN